MARTKSVRRGCNAARTTLSLLIALFIWTATSAAYTGPAISLKIGAQTLDDPIDLEKTTRARVEVEIASPLMCDDHFDLALAFGGSSLGSLHDDYSYPDGGGWIDEHFLDELTVLDVRLAARLYPFGYDESIRPYVGAGIGYFWFLDYWEYRYAETFEDPFFPGTFHTAVDEEEDVDTMAHGLFPFVTAGVAIAVSENVELLFEFQYDIDKEDEGIDLSGPIYMFGGRVRF